MAPENLRSVLIIALCVVSFLLWQAWQKDYGPGSVPASGVVTPTSVIEAPSVPSSADTESATGLQAPAMPDEVIIDASGELTSTPRGRVAVRTDLYDIVLSANAIHSLKLTDYPLTESTPDIAFPLLTNSPEALFVAESVLIGSNNEPSAEAVFTPRTTVATLVEGKDTLEVAFDWKGPGGISVEKTYVFHRDSYEVDVNYEVDNATGEPWSGRVYSYFRRTQVADEGGLFRVYTYTGGIVSSPEKPYEKVDFSDMSEAPLSRDVVGGWAAMIQHYFAAAWIPPQDSNNHYFSEALPQAQYRLGLYYDTVLAANENSRWGLKAYIGPKIKDRLENAGPGLERTVDYGWLFFLAEPMFVVLRWIHSIVHNWGWTIIAFTVLLKGVFFWLSAASYRSMARMRKLQPRIVTLRERHKDDKQRMNQAMMELYKTEKINPLGGCLPILVQIPFFIALYWVLLESVELRQSPFIWWITDLAQKDPYYVLPLLMGASMFIQQRLNPAPPDPLQAKIMMALPFVFTIFFLGFPSGLVLYWFMNNLLSIAQQYVITKKIEAEK